MLLACLTGCGNLIVYIRKYKIYLSYNPTAKSFFVNPQFSLKVAAKLIVDYLMWRKVSFGKSSFSRKTL